MPFAHTSPFVNNEEQYRNSWERHASSCRDVGFLVLQAYAFALGRIQIAGLLYRIFPWIRWGFDNEFDFISRRQLHLKNSFRNSDVMLN